MLRMRLAAENTDNNSSIASEFWLSPIGLQFHIAATAIKGNYDSWEPCLSAAVLDNVILLVARFGNCIGHLYLGATVNTMYELYQSLEQKNGIDFICVITDKKKRYVQYMHRFFLREELVNKMLEALNTFSPVSDEYMDNMNESRQPHELVCKQMLEKTEIKIGSQ